MKHINKIEKKIWDNNNFEEMGWHDNKIYGLSFGVEEYEISFDIDYIFKWIAPEKNETNFKFQISPATLVFRNVYDLNISFSSVNIIIEEVYRDNPTTPKNYMHIKEPLEYDWTIKTTNGDITFKSVGFIQYIRQEACILEENSIGLVRRKGISFEPITF